MASISSSKVLALGALIFSFLVTYASCARPVNFTASDFTADPNWEAARATWYGAPTGAGPDDDGGACGFKNVNLPPFSAMTSCGNQPLFKDGKGCGSCYQIRCQNHPACSGNPETVIITDVVQVDLMEANSGYWTPMRESWGSIWRLDANHRLQAPFSLRVTNESGRKLVATRVIPANWAPNTYYRSIIQY
uniref:Expansin-B4 n=1 Tax=Zea mays TaxID=4577 RepID=A0A804R3T3_MAIZE